MFGQVLYYIVALLIYSTYQPIEATRLSFIGSLILFFVLCIFFAGITRLKFQKIILQSDTLTFRQNDHRFNSALTQYSILAIALYAIDIYALNAVSFLNTISIFQKIPTIETLFFLMLFIGYLSVVWGYSYDAYQQIYKTQMTRSEYVSSNISFSLPVLLPWLILSITTDLINLIPFEAPKRFLSSTEGQILYFLLFLFALAMVGPAFIQKFWRCRPLGSGFVRSRIESMCRSADMKFRDILLWPLFGGKMATAGVMGLIRQFRYILITPALIDQLEPEEIDAVIAHEIGHVKKKHLLFYLFFFVGYLVVAFSVLDLIIYFFQYIEAVYRVGEKAQSALSTLISVGFSVSTILVFLIYFRYVFGFFMRNFERQADIYAYSAVGSAYPLISTFEKISIASGQSPDRPNWHHFSIRERISFLIQCDSDRSCIDRQNAKIRKSIFIYLLSIIILGWVGYGIHYGTARETINAKILKKTIANRIKAEPDNADLYQTLGDLYYSEKDYKNTIRYYQEALSNNPDQQHALNNLAWLHATCDDSRFRDPPKAVELAKRAAAISGEAYILDTLAEAYYADGNFNAAVQTEQEALTAAKDNISYYQDQLAKFKKAPKVRPRQE